MSATQNKNIAPKQPAGLVGRLAFKATEDGRFESEVQFVADLGGGYYLASNVSHMVPNECIITVQELAENYPNGRRKYRIFENRSDALEYYEAFFKNKKAG